MGKKGWKTAFFVCEMPKNMINLINVWRFKENQRILRGRI